MPTVYLPAEIFTRELISKTVLAGFLSSQGLRVIFGHQWYVTNAAFANSKQGDFFFVNHPIGEGYKKYLAPILRKGVNIVGCEEEGVFDQLNYRDRIIEEKSEDCFSEFKLWMPWGPRDRRVIQEFLPQSTILTEFGTPRSALWGNLGRKLFSHEISKAQRDYGEFVLVATSFDSELLQHVAAASKLNEHGPFQAENLYQADVIINSESSIQKTIIAIQTILESTKYNIVIRPYKHYKDVHIRKILDSIKAQNKARVFVDTSIFINPLVHASQAVIHNGSTVGIESLRLGKRTIALNNFLGQSVENHQKKISSILSVLPKYPYELVDCLNSPSNYILEKVEEFVSPSEGQSFYKTLLENMLTINPFFDLHSRSNYGDWNRTKRSFLYRTATNLRRGPMHKYDESKRPKISDKIVLEFLNRSQQTFHSNPGKLNFNIIEKNTYKIE